MSRELRLVIIGVGAIAELIARSVRELDGVSLLAGSCRTREKGERFAHTFACRWFDDYARMLDEVRPDVAVVSTPSGAHLDPVLACAQRGIHVLCEKPLEVTTDRIVQMIGSAEQAGILLGGIFPLRFNPVVGVLHDAASEGRFGNLALVAAAVPWWRDDAYYAPGRWQGTRALDGGGALMNQAIHLIDLIQWIVAGSMGGMASRENPVDEVFAYTAQRGHEPASIDVEDTAAAVLRFRNGALGQIVAATSMYPGSLRRLLVGGRDGTAEIVEDQLIGLQFRQPRPEDGEALARFGRPTSHGGGAANPMAIDHSNHRRNIAAFLDAVRSGRAPELDAREAAKAVAIIEACYRSAADGVPVRPQALP